MGKEIEYNSVPTAISGSPGNYSVNASRATLNTELVISATGIKPSTELAEVEPLRA